MGHKSERKLSGCSVMLVNRVVERKVWDAFVIKDKKYHGRLNVKFVLHNTRCKENGKKSFFCQKIHECVCHSWVCFCGPHQRSTVWIRSSCLYPPCFDLMIKNRTWIIYAYCVVYFVIAIQFTQTYFAWHSKCNLPF